MRSAAGRRPARQPPPGPDSRGLPSSPDSDECRLFAPTPIEPEDQRPKRLSALMTESVAPNLRAGTARCSSHSTTRMIGTSGRRWATSLRTANESTPGWSCSTMAHERATALILDLSLDNRCGQILVRGYPQPSIREAPRPRPPLHPERDDGTRRQPVSRLDGRFPYTEFSCGLTHSREPTCFFYRMVIVTSAADCHDPVTARASSSRTVEQWRSNTQPHWESDTTLLSCERP